jgi:hypothetical protein
MPLGHARGLRRGAFQRYTPSRRLPETALAKPRAFVKPKALGLSFLEARDLRFEIRMIDKLYLISNL